MNDNLKLLQADLKENRARDEEARKAAFEEVGELTDDEKERIEKLRDTPAIFVEDTDAEGRTTQVPVTEYAKPLDNNQVTLRNELEGYKETLKVISTGQVSQSVETLQEDAKRRSLAMFKQLATGANAGISDDDYLAINAEAITALETYLVDQKIDKALRKDGRMDVDKTVNFLSKSPMSRIMQIFPEQFLKVYLTDQEMKVPTPAAKERLLTSVAYLLTTGPDMNYVNEYIDGEERLMVVSQRLAKCQIDFGEMLKDERKMSELLMESRKYSAADDSFWAKYIGDPKLLHSKFAHNVVIYQFYLDAYTKVLGDYPESDPANVEARKIIQNEISECNDKIAVYSSICELSMARELWAILVTRYQTDKRVSMDFLTKEAINAVEQVRRCKQNLPFPGFKQPTKSAERLFAGYMVSFREMVAKYNETLSDIVQKETEAAEAETELPDTRGISPIGIPNYADTEVELIYGLLMMILMGRILRRCTRNEVTKADAITLDAYFQIFCNMGTDLYVMQSFWDLMKDFVKEVLDKFYLPAAATEAAKIAKKVEKQSPPTESAKVVKAFNASALGASTDKKKKKRK